MSSSDRAYSVNLRRVAMQLLPTWWRRPLLGSLAQAAVSAQSGLLSELRGFRVEKHYRMVHNGQVCKLRGALNDEFDPEGRRIRIEDGGGEYDAGGAVIWQRELGKWVVLPKRGDGCAVVNRRGYVGTSGYDFRVVVPEALSESETRIRAMVNMYKLASKRYAVNFE